MIPIITKPDIVSKAWGEERIIYNGAEYCGKVLCFNKGAKFSFHFHVIKKESWYCSKGQFAIYLMDSEKGLTYETTFSVGEIVTLEPGQAHQLYAIEESEIFEVSTQHFDNDSYRIAPGDSQK